MPTSSGSSVSMKLPTMKLPNNKYLNYSIVMIVIEIMYYGIEIYLMFSCLHAHTLMAREVSKNF